MLVSEVVIETVDCKECAYRFTSPSKCESEIIRKFQEDGFKIIFFRFIQDQCQVYLERRPEWADCPS